MIRKLVITILSIMGFLIIYPIVRPEFGLPANILAGVPVIIIASNYGMTFGIIGSVLLSLYITLIFFTSPNEEPVNNKTRINI